ncbi:hypothetical protein ONZ51_g4729 [Trametes cubensis]|uniref:Asteroid domain-containing protein n=1 Tax=Trametes cubensis TaxID=1111947 RepID=A0AAD7TWD1_9APHY|nr:hypothetical protein ONZ51_g4729 [Trametes cubensis]
MGVHGLTTYLREHKPILSRTVHLPPQHPNESVPIVVDGWSFIYEVVHCGNLPWVYGGEYPELAQLIQQVVRAWVGVGINLHVVFDGPYPTLKFPTLVSRVTQNHIQNSLLFFRTSSVARSTPRFLHETAMLPPMAYSVCLDTLTTMASKLPPEKLHIHIADEEGDPYAVALAGRLQAYIAGRDSDFVVLNAEGYQGYIPLDEMVWISTHNPTANWDGEGSVYSVDTEADVNDDGFKPARSGKKRQKRNAIHQQAGHGILPPNESSELDAQLSLSFIAYSPSTLASHLEIPASLLPLLGALVGNDFTGSSDDSGPPTTAVDIRTNRRANLQRLFFERQLTLGQRIARVAGTLKEILATAFGQGGAPHKKRVKKQIGSVMDLIDAAVTALLLRPLDTFATGEREAIVERVVEATLQYAVPKPPEEDMDSISEQDEGERGHLNWVSDVCPLHLPESCPLFASLSRLASQQLPGPLEPIKPVEGMHASVRREYIAAYRRGCLNPHIFDAVQSATSWPWIFLEDPDKECVQRSIGRPIREWVYAVLDASVGLPSPPVTEDAEEDEDEDELIDVVEEDDDVDPLARLRGALKELDDPEEDEEGSQEPPLSAPSVSSTLASSRPKIITEYIRRGTRLAPEEVMVTPLAEMLKGISLQGPVHPQTSIPLPPPLWPENLRRTLLLSAMESNHPAVASLPDDRLMAVLVLRFVVHRMHVRAQENPGVKERQMERWSQAEARAFLACMFTPHDGSAEIASEDQRSVAVPIQERHIQLVAQLSAALHAAEQLLHVLLLAPQIAIPVRLFSGLRFHALLTGSTSSHEKVVEGDLWRACWEGLEDAYAELPQRKSKKEKKAMATGAGADVSRAKGKTKRPTGAASMFGLLGDAEA